MNRARFLAAASAPLAAAVLGVSGDGASDASLSSTLPSLRVLLGKAPARRIDAGTFSYDGRRYRGTFTLLPDGNVLSVVPLEAYLYGVVAREMSPSWPPAALQVQAVCARTYVLQRSDPRRAYDVASTEADQVYGGIDAEYQAATDAVDATVGQVLQYGGDFAQIAYSSCCGGHTESSADAWNGPPISYMDGVPCPWCVGSPEYAWTSTLDAAAVMRATAGAAGPIGTVTGLALGAADRSGRVRAFGLTGSLGSTTVKGGDFRRLVGSRIVRSLLVSSVRATGDPDAPSFVLTGTGLGHGVGLCQWGANFMAAAGRSAADIAAFYFPGTQIAGE